jgi:type II secretory pathway pseudopilin PulG
MNFSIHSRRGQTLVEALIALSILTVGFMSIVTLLTKSFQLNRTTSNDTQATYLAAEGIEVAKNIIDHDVYYGLSQSSSTNDWGCSFGLTPGTPVDYALEYDNYPTNCGAPPTVQSEPTGDKLYLIAATDNPDFGMYTYNSFGNQLTDFTRDVIITAVSNDELDVKSTVKWTDGGQSNTITLEDHFYNWHQ